MKVSYEWLQTFFDTDALPPVADIEDTLTFHAFEIEGVEEIGNTSVVDVDVLPNRAADSMSHRGIAREISTLLNIPMQNDPLREQIELTPRTDSVSLSLDENASCSYYVVAHITGVSVGESPQWLKDRLEAIGQKSINNIVDATNYVLFGLGQPTHVFDAAKLAGSEGLIGLGTRRAKEGEKITLLGGNEVALSDTMTIIVDTNNDTPLAVAGVKGGTVAEVSNETKDIIIEAAKFHPIQTRKTAQALKMRTDASARFENDVSDPLTTYGADAVVQLILDIAGGDLVGYTTAGGVVEENKSVTITAARVSKLLGTDITNANIEDIFTRLQFTYTQEGDEFTVTAPFERRDVRIPEDVIEEIGRVYGYNKIGSKQLGALEKQPLIHKKFAYTELIRNILSEHDATEVYLYSLRDSGEVALVNSLASDKDHLRKNLSDGLQELLDKSEKNMPLLGLYEAVSVFEIGNVFTKKTEETHICVGVRVAGVKKKEQRTHKALIAIKEVLEQRLGVSLPEPKGEILEWNLDALLDMLPDLDTYPETKELSDDIVYTPFSQYPFVLRDIAVWVPESTTQERIQEIIKNNGGNLLQRCDVFDVFTKEGRTSYAFHLVFQSMEETLTDEKVGAIMKLIEDAMSTQNGWEIR